MKRFIEQTSELNDLISMIGSIAALDFSKRLDVELSDDPSSVIAFGLNMLSEELEENVVKRSVLEEVNRNLEQFAYVLAHDIKSPLGIAIGILSIMESEAGLREEGALREYLPPLKSSLLRIDSMINGILEYSRTSFDNVRIEELSLHRICEEITALYPLQTRPEVTLQDEIPLLWFNETALKQILQNLVGNAVQYNDKPVCRIQVSCTSHPDFYEICVQDNGPGIPEEHLSSVFELFETFGSTSSNYGVGLAIVKKLVEQAGGHVSVSAAPGGGTMFSFTVSRHFVHQSTKS